MVVHVVCTQPQILNTDTLDATMDWLDCSFCFYFLVSKDTTKLGLMLQAINLRVSMKILRVFMKDLRVSMRNRYLSLTNQITTFVTTMI